MSKSEQISLFTAENLKKVKSDGAERQRARPYFNADRI